MNLNFVTVILLLASAQGFFLALIIFQKHGTLFANRFLGVLIVIYSLVLLNMFFSDIGLYLDFPSAIPITMGVPLLLGPLHFLYVKYLTQNRQKMGKWEVLHFFPFLLVSLFFVISFHEQDEIRASLFYSDVENYPNVLFVFNWLLIVQVFCYVLVSLYIIKRYSRYYKDTFSAMEQVRLDWIRNITYLIGLGIIIFSIENLFLQIGINISNYFAFSSIIVAVYVYTLGYTGFIKSEIFEEPETALSIHQIPSMSYQYQMMEKEDITSQGGKYEKSGLSKVKSEEYIKELKRVMDEQKPYTNGNLSLHQLAKFLDITPHNLSEVINIGLDSNFFDFVNHYRVENVKRDLKDDQKSHLKLLSLALDAGFNSKSSFNAIFKKHTGMTPSEYRQKVSAS